MNWMRTMCSRIVMTLEILHRESSSVVDSFEFFIIILIFSELDTQQKPRKKRQKPILNEEEYGESDDEWETSVTHGIMGKLRDRRRTKKQKSTDSKFDIKFNIKREKKSMINIPCDVPECPEQFPSWYFLRKHKDLMHQTAQCDYCEQFMLKNDLVKHMKTSHRPSIPCTMPNCTKTFDREPLLLKHIKWDHRMIECEVCKKEIVAKRFRHHMKVVHLNMEMSMCDLCGQVYKTIVAYKRHFETAHTKTEQVQCEICKAFVKNKTVLYSHMRNLHGGNDPITCPICGHQSPNMKAAKLHLVFHKKKEEMQYMCSICGQRFVSKAQMIQHSNVHKTIREKFNCPECDREFISKSGLKVRHSVIN